MSSGTVDQAIAERVQRAHDDGLTIVEAMKVVMAQFGLSLGDAKQVVTAQPCWRLVVKASQPLQEEAMRIISTSTGHADPA